MRARAFTHAYVCVRVRACVCVTVCVCEASQLTRLQPLHAWRRPMYSKVWVTVCVRSQKMLQNDWQSTNGYTMKDYNTAVLYYCSETNARRTCSSVCIKAGTSLRNCFMPCMSFATLTCPHSDFMDRVRDNGYASRPGKFKKKMFLPLCNDGSY